MNPPVFTLEEIVKQLQRQWGGTDENITRSWADNSIEYSMPDSAPLHSGTDGETTLFVPMTATQKDFAREAFEMWDDLIKPSLTETTSADAQITMAYSGSTKDGGTYTSPFLIPSTAGPFHFHDQIDHERIWMNNGAAVWPELQDGNMRYGERGFQAYIHEIGHALGLSHPGTYNAGDGATYATGAEYSQDTQQYTVMSYWVAGDDGVVVDRTGSAATTDVNSDGINVSSPLLHDIAAIQAIYGADTETRKDNTTYGFNSNADRGAFHFDQNPNPVVAIWDGGGYDRLDLSGYTQNQRIDLHAGAFSDVGALTKNVAIAYGVQIESALGGSGNDSITGNDADNVLNGMAGADVLFGAGGLDLLYGADGNDTLNGGLGFVDELYGGAGNDTYVVDEQEKIVESFDAGIDTVRSSVRWELGNNLENLTLTGSANVNGFGNALDNVITGNSGNNYLQGFAGADSLWGGAGNDYYELGDLTFKDESSGFQYDSVHESPNGGTDTVSVGYHGNSRYFLDDNVENVVVVGTEGLNVVGNDLANVFTGNNGHNLFSGQGGADTLNGGGGADELLGGKGDDTYLLDDLTAVGGAIITHRFDAVVEAANEGTDSVFVRSLFAPDRAGTNDYTLTANVENGTITGDQAFNLRGNELDNALLGNNAANTLNGFAGGDRLNGAGGFDQLIGGAGNDTYVLDDSTKLFQSTLLQFDSVTEAAGEGIDTVLVRSLADPLLLGANAYTLSANVENGTITGTNVFNLGGNTLGNSLLGNEAANTLSGGLGVDRLTGGAGTDHFADSAVNLQGDFITDFGYDDEIDVSGPRFSGVHYNKATGALDLDSAGNNSFATHLHLAAGLSGEFVATGSAAGQAASTAVRLMADTDGDGIGDFHDNAILVANANQRDTDRDGYGNVVDPDLDQNHIVDLADLALLGDRYLGSNADADFNGDRIVDLIDLSVMAEFYGGPPGRSYVDHPLAGAGLIDVATTAPVPTLGVDDPRDDPALPFTFLHATAPEAHLAHSDHHLLM